MEVLIVDDNPIILKVVGQSLERAGYTVRRASSVWSARRSLEADGADLAVLDIELGDGTGLELAHWIRHESELRGLPILFLTMHGDDDTVRQAEAVGGSSFLLKPVKGKALEQAIEHLIWMGGTPAVAETSCDPDTDALIASLDAGGGSVFDSTPLVESVESVARRLAAGFHRGALRLLGVMARPNSAMSDYAEVVASEAALSEAVLRRVNSAHFGVRKRVTSAAEACSLLGLRELCSTCLKTVGGTSTECDRLIERIWTHGLYTGFVASRCARFLCEEEQAAVAQAGILHAVGIVAILQDRPDEYRPIIERAESDRVALADLELERLGFGHPELGALIASHLGASDRVTRLIRAVADPELVMDAPAWCVAVASVAIQMKFTRLPRRPDPPADLKALAVRHPSCWKDVARRLPGFLQQLEEHPEIFQA